MQSNIYEYLCDRLDNIPRILELCGADRRYINENASDFEKFRELCITLVRFSGSSIYRDINSAVSEIFGEDIDITQSHPEHLWKRFYGEVENGEFVIPVLTVKTICADKLTNVIDISQATNFVMPDKYHVGLAREKLACGQDLSESEKNMLIIQDLRERGQTCISTLCPLILRADCSTEITRRALGYLKNCNLLNDALMIVSLERLCTDMAEVLEFDKISLGVMIEKCDERTDSSVKSLAQIFPVGNIIWVLKKEKFGEFCSVLEKLVKQWQAERIAPEKRLLKFEKN